MTPFGFWEKSINSVLPSSPYETHTCTAPMPGGDHRESSDVDIMVISPLSRDALHDHRWDFAHISSEISMDYDVTVSLTVRAEDQFKPQTIPYHGNVVKDGIRYSAIGTHA